MKALVYDGQLRLATDYPPPTLRPGDALVDVRLAGVCQTDIEITRGYMDFRGVLGHEFVGTVVRGADAASERLVGRRVVGEINCVCGACEMCLAGLKTHCLKRTTLGIDRRDGCFAEQVAVPAINLHAVPDHVPDEAAVFTEPLAAAFQVVQQARPQARHKSVVVGDGRLGQLVAQVLIDAGLRPMVIGLHEGKLRRLERLGISTMLADDVRPRKDAHLVVEASGSAAGLQMAMQLVRPRGTIVLKSTIAADAGLNLSPIVVDEVTVLGSRCGPFAEAIAALAAGRIDIAGLTTAEYPLDRAAEAVEAAQKPDALKVLIRP